jgi:hypothetical protein
MDETVSVERTPTGWACDVREGGLRARILLAEGNGRVSVKEVRITSEAAGGDIDASPLSAAPYARWLRAAYDAVIRKQRAGGRGDDHAEVRPFLEDRRGKPPRSDEDYANLAWLYVAWGPSTARILAAQYGGSIQTWRNHLSKAKRFVRMVEQRDTDGGVRLVPELTEEANRLVYGDDPHEWEGEVSDYQEAVEFVRVMEDPQTREECDRQALILKHQTRAEIDQRLSRSRQVIAAREE